MSRKITNLSVHKNTTDKRRKKTVANDITRMGAKLCRDVDVRAYALVAIDAQGNGHSIWDTGSIIPMWGFPETMTAILKRDIEASGVDETWVPPVLPVKG